MNIQDLDGQKDEQNKARLTENLTRAMFLSIMIIRV